METTNGQPGPNTAALPSPTSKSKPAQPMRSTLRAQTQSPVKIRCGRVQSTEGPQRTKMNFHERHLAHLAKLRQAQVDKAARVEEEKQRLEFTRQRLAHQVLKRQECEKRQEQNIALTSTLDNDLERKTVDSTASDGKGCTSKQQAANLRELYRSRHEEYLRQVQTTFKNKQIEQKQCKEKAANCKQKLKAELGYLNVSSKLLEPTVSSLISSNADPDVIVEMKGERAKQLIKWSQKGPATPSATSSQTSLLPQTPNGFNQTAPNFSEKLEEQQRSPPQSSLLLRAQQQIAKVAEKKAAEVRREQEAKDRQNKALKAARNAVTRMRSSSEYTRVKPKAQKAASDDVFEPQTSPPKKLVSKKDEEMIIRRLAVVPKSRAPPITDMNMFRKRYRLEPGQKVFIISKNYTIAREALLERGWFENKDKNSPCFDLKWVPKVKDIDFPNLFEHQIVNHFDRGQEITTKWGLAKNLRNMIWYNTIDPNTFYPRQYHLKDSEDYEEFLSDYKATKA